MRFLPESRAGRRAVLLTAAAISLGAAANLIATTQGNTIEYPNPINSPLLGTVLYLTFLAAFAAAFAGVVAVRRHRERSVLVYLVIILGGGLALAALLLAIGGLIGPPGP